MQLLCKVSTPFSDVACPTCGEGFLVYWTRQRAGEREHQRLELQQALREQHIGAATREAHPPAFQVAEASVPMPRRRPAPASTTIPVYQ